MVAARVEEATDAAAKGAGSRAEAVMEEEATAPCRAGMAAVTVVEG